MPGQILISFNNPNPTGGVSLPGPLTDVGQMVFQNDTSDIITKGFRTNLPLAQGAVTAGDRLWLETGEYIQWEIAETPDGSPNLYPDGSPKFITCWTTCQLNGFQRRKLLVQKDNARAIPAFVQHTQVAASVGNLITDERTGSYTGEFNLVGVFNGITDTLKNLTKAHRAGPVVHRITVEQFSTNGDLSIHTIWELEFFSGLPQASVQVWRKYTNTSEANLGAPSVTSNGMHVKECEVSWYDQSKKFAGIGPFNYTQQNFNPHNLAIAEGQPICRIDGQLMFYDAASPPAATSPEGRLFTHLRRAKTQGTSECLGANWGALGLWGPDAQTGTRPPWIATEELFQDAALNYARSIYSPAVFGTASHFYRAEGVMANTNPGATGDAPGFGIRVMFNVMAAECPMGLHGFRLGNTQEANRPVFILESDGSWPTIENHPDCGIWVGIPFQGNTCNPPTYLFGGMDAVGAENVGKRLDGACGAGVAPATTPFGEAWSGYDEQHFSLAGICAYWLATGCPITARMIDHYRQAMRLHLHRADFGVRFPNQVIGKLFQPRGEGRSSHSCSWIEFCSPDADLRDSINGHVLDMLDPNGSTAGTVMNTITLGTGAETTDYTDIFNSGDVKAYNYQANDSRVVENAHVTWEEGLLGMALSWRAVCRDQQVRDKLETLLTPIAYSLVDNIWFLSNTAPEVGQFHMFKSLRFNEGALPTDPIPPAVDYEPADGYPSLGERTGAFQVLRDGGQFWSLNMVLYAYVQALAEGRDSTRQKAAQILNQYRNDWATGPGGNNLYTEAVSIRYDRSCLIPEIGFDPLVTTFNES